MLPLTLRSCTCLAVNFLCHLSRLLCRLAPLCTKKNGGSRRRASYTNFCRSFWRNWIIREKACCLLRFYPPRNCSCHFWAANLLSRRRRLALCVRERMVTVDGLVGGLFSINLRQILAGQWGRSWVWSKELWVDMAKDSVSPMAEAQLVFFVGTLDGYH